MESRRKTEEKKIAQSDERVEKEMKTERTGRERERDGREKEAKNTKFVMQNEGKRLSSQAARRIE